MAIVSAVRLLPQGTFRLRRGLPSIVATRGMTAAAFGGAGAWLPLLLTLVHGFGQTMAGTSLLALSTPEPGRVVFGAILTGGAAVAFLGTVSAGRVVTP